MITLNLRDGSTRKYDPAIQEERDQLNKLGKSPKEIENITGILINSQSYTMALPIPQRFRRVFFIVEMVKKNGGEARGIRMILQADDIRSIATMYFGTEPRMVKYFIKKTGKQRFNPEV